LTETSRCIKQLEEDGERARQLCTQAERDACLVQERLQAVQPVVSNEVQQAEEAEWKLAEMRGTMRWFEVNYAGLLHEHQEEPAKEAAVPKEENEATKEEPAKEEAKERELRRFFNDHNISYQTSSTVWKFLGSNNILQPRKCAADDVKVFAMLPYHLRETLLDESFSPFMEGHPLFELYGLMSTNRSSMKQLSSQACRASYLRSGDELFSATTRPVTSMVFVTSGMMAYTHQDEQCHEIQVLPGQWCCEEILWGCPRYVQLNGTLGADPCYPTDLFLLDPDIFRSTAKMYDQSGLLQAYAAAFVKSFNELCLTDGCMDLLFNNVKRIDALVEEVINFQNNVSMHHAANDN